MSSTMFEAYSQITTGPGTANGVLPVTSSAGYAVGAVAYLSDPTIAAEPTMKVQIRSIPDSTHVGVCFIPRGTDDVDLRNGTITFPNYGFSDVSAYLVGCVLSMPTQLVADEPL